MNPQEKLCILCLHILEEGEPYSELNKTNILEDLKLVNPNFVKDFALDEGALVCHTCTKELNTFARFKEQIISSEIKLETNSTTNLDEFLLTLSKDVNLLCRTCFTTPSGDEVFEKNWTDYECVFLQCEVELNKQILQPSMLCNSCHSKLEAMKDFITLCLENEERIRKIKAEHENLTNEELASIIKVTLNDKCQKTEEEDPVLELQVNTMGTPKMYKKKRSTTSETPSTSQSSAEIILNGKDILTKIKEQMQQMHISIDASPSENQADVTLNMNELGFSFDTPATEYNLTQELIDVLEGRLREDTSCDEATKELIDVLEGRFNESPIQDDAVPTSPKVTEKRQLRLRTITEADHYDSSKESDSETSEIRKKTVVTKVEEVTVEPPPKRKRGRPRKEKTEPPVKKAKTVTEVESESDDSLKQIEKKLTNRPLQVTVIKSKKRTNKAQLDKTWQELTSATPLEKVTPKTEPVKEPVEITVVKKKTRQGGNVKPKKEVVWMHCSKCSFKTYAQNSFIQHQLIHTIMSELPTLYCEHCRFNTTSEEMMAQHTATHETANLSYKCVFCDDFFKKKTSCMYHTLRHDDQDVASQFYCLVYNGAADEEYFECYQCDYQNTEESPMPDHVIDHTIEIPKNPMLAKFKCHLCPFLTKTEEVLERHKKLQHSGKNKGKKKSKEDVLTNEELPLLKCDKCHYMTRHSRSLVNHIGLKHNRTIPPLVAGEALAAKAANEGKTMYYCNECSYSTYRKLNMPRHMLVHRTKENMIMYECPHCIFETKHRRSYTRHMEAKHGVVV